MLISVTQRHIDQGEPGSDCNCPIAQAMIDAGLCAVSVSLTRAYFVNNQQACEVPLPESAIAFIDAFDDPYDDAKKTQPFEFVL